MRLTITILLVSLSLLAAGQCDSVSFELQVVNPTCKGNDGRIEVVNLHGTAPFQIMGAGNNFTAGTYHVQVSDACGNIRTRTATLSAYAFDFTWSYTTSCGMATFSFPDTTLTYTLNGQSVTTVPFPAYYAITATDSCGNQKTKYQYLNKEYGGYIKELQYQLFCDSVSIFPVYYGFSAGPVTVCLYDFATKALIECKTAPAGYSGGYLTNFFGKPYGVEYYVIVSDGCYRDSAYFPDMTSAGGSQIDPYDWDCTTFKMHVDAPAPPASFYANNPTIYGSPDSICLFRQSDNSLVGCKPLSDHLNWINPRTGVVWESGAVWDSLPYGCYYAYIFDPCMDTTFRIDSCVSYPNNFKSALAANCQVVQTGLQVWFDPGGKRPFTTEIIYPNGVSAGVWTDNRDYHYITYPTYPKAGTITVIQSDACGYSDTSYLEQPAIYPQRKTEVVGGCLGPNGSNGSGNIILRSNYISSSVVVIQRDGRDTLIEKSYSVDSTYYFNNLPAGTYVIESAVGCYGFKVYDTVEIKPYQFPHQMVMLQGCSGGFMAFKDSVSGGVGPFIYQLVQPYQTTQGHGNFLIGVDTTTTIEMKVTDACGNSHSTSFMVNPASCRILGVQVEEREEKAKGIRIFPNPNRGRFTVSINRKKQDYQMEILNAVGARLWSGEYKNIDKKDITIERNLPGGLYYLRINKEVYKLLFL